MLKVITDEAAIRRCQRQLGRSLRPHVTARFRVRLGHPGASAAARVAWSERLGIWFARHDGADRYDNAFGLRRPGETASVTSTCEVNVPRRGIDRRMGGAYAADTAGRVFLVHRGVLGGARKGIGKSLFEEHYHGVWTSLEDGEVRSDVAVVGMLKSPRFARQLAQFVRKVDRIKQHAHALSSLQLEIFTEAAPGEEFLGGGIFAAPADLAALTDVVLVVKDLSERLARAGLTVRANGRQELFVAGERDRIAALFRIVTEPSEAAFATAVTRLLLDGLDQPERPRAVLVLPGPAAAETAEKLRRLGIEVVSYDWQDDKAVFAGLQGILPAAPVAG